MSARSGYEPGTPSWVDLGTPDPDASARFYGELFGWETEEAGPPEETGGYRMFTKDGKRVAGVGPLMQEGQPVVWSSYVSVDDADAVAAKVPEAGGQVAMAPMDVTDAGRFAFFIDPAGAFLGVWQPKRTIGAEVVNEAGALCWNELQTRDLDASKGFYPQVFGWEADPMDMDGFTYHTWKLGDKGIAGMLDMPAQVPAEVPSFWLVYFGTDDLDASVAKVEQGGGSVVMPTVDMPIGRFAIVTDPHGATFGLFEAKSWD